MKKLIYILYPFLFWANFFGDFDCSELAKVPHLFRHFLEHKNFEGNDNKSFLDFVVEHYTDGDENEPEEEHEKLPFHGHSEMTSIYFIEFSNLKSIDFVPKIYRSNFFYINSNYQLNWFDRLIKPPLFQ